MGIAEQALIGVGIAAFSVVANGMVNITIKFAPDATTARRDLEVLAWRIGAWISTGANAVFLYQVVSSPGPVTKLIVLLICSQVGSLVFFLASRYIGQAGEVMKRVERYVEKLEAQRLRQTPSQQSPSSTPPEADPPA